MFIFIFYKMSSFDEKILNAVNDIAESNQKLIEQSETSNPFKGKWVSIIGDSMSTYQGYMPEGNTTYYPKDDVDDVNKTWWHILLTKLGAKLCVNESWGDRKVCGSDAQDVKNAMGGKLHRVKGNTYTNLDGTTETATEDVYPDIILIAVGVNDFLNASTLGDASSSTGVKPNYTTNFYIAYDYMLVQITQILYYKNAQIYCLNTPYTSKIALFGTNTNGNTQLDFNKVIENGAESYGIHFINLFNLCIHDGNASINLIDKIYPKAIMMNKIANQCYNEIMADNCY